MAHRIVIDVAHSTGDTVRVLEFVSNALDDFRPAFRALEPKLEQSWHRLFESQGASARTPWPTYAQTPESYRYVVVKSRILGRDMRDDDILRWEPGVRERLYPSLARRTGASVRRFGKLRMERGTRLAYARNHETGTGFAPKWAWPKRTGRYQIPRRRLMVTDDRFARTDAPEALENWLFEVEAQASMGGRGQTGLASQFIQDGAPTNAF
jgi:hypothetical protein